MNCFLVSRDKIYRLERKKEYFKKGRGFLDEITVILATQKHQDKSRKSYVAFMDLYEAFDQVGLKGQWKMMRVSWYGK